MILFVMTGSVVLPVKALLMNLLTLSAAFGLLVLIFQDGRLEGLLAYESQGALEATQPILLFCVAFGLSTDYGVFLLTRIKEARDGGLPATARRSRSGSSARAGSSPPPRCCSASRSAPSPPPRSCSSRSSGVGTALAVLIDAFIVRALLVPSLMALLGRWNWWAPRPLARLHARLGLRGGRDAGRRHGARVARRDALARRGQRALVDRARAVRRLRRGLPDAGHVAAVDDPARRAALAHRPLRRGAAGRTGRGRRATIERAGPLATTVSLRLEQDGRPMALALGACATWRDGEPEWAAARARRAAARGLRAAAARRPDAAASTSASRSAGSGPLVGDGARNLAWLRLDPPRAARPPRADRAVGRLDAGRLLEARRRFGAPDRRPHDPLPRARCRRGDWVLADYRSRFSAGGAWEEDGELWAPTARCSPSRASWR